MHKNEIIIIIKRQKIVFTRGNARQRGYTRCLVSPPATLTPVQRMDANGKTIKACHSAKLTETCLETILEIVVYSAMFCVRLGDVCSYLKTYGSFR